VLEAKYVLITAARNEDKYVGATIESIISQTICPSKWIIVSDNSTDQTDAIVNEYSKSYSFIQLLARGGEAKRNFGSQVRAINYGYNQIKDDEYRFVGNLDADITLDSDYYENIIKKFETNHGLGLAGGYIYEKYKGVFKVRSHNSENSVAHAIQLFRRECFETIGGYVEMPYGGPDWVAEVMARSTGWEVAAYPDIKVYHHRYTLTADGRLRGRYQQGLMDYSIGSHPVFEVLKCMSRLNMQPYVLGAMWRLYGYITAWLRREKRPVSDDFVKYIQKEQIARIRNIHQEII